MSRHGYSDDDTDNLAIGRWRGLIASASRGKRGQEFFLALLAALDAMPEKRLVAEDLVREDGDCCALGALGLHRGIPNIGALDPEDHEHLGGVFNIAPCLVAETEYQNDEGAWKESPEQRWSRMRRWCERNIKRAELAGESKESAT